MVKSFVIIGIFFSAAFSSNIALRGLEHHSLSLDVLEQDQEALYLPQGPALKIMSFGYQNFLSRILWFNTISYFGKHYRGDRNYKWLAHMCDLVTTLDPRAYHVYEFAALMLAWEAEQPERAIPILTKGMNVSELKDHPWFWKLTYLRGFTYMYFMEDSMRALEDFKVAAKLPNAPASVASIAAKKILYNAGDPGAAIGFLEEMLGNTTDPTARKALNRRLREARENLAKENLDKKDKLNKGEQS